MPNPSPLMADLVLALHLAFVLFAALGGLLLRAWPRAAWLHVPAVLWAAIVMFTGWVCPLTPLEERIRGMTGGVSNSFLGRLLNPLLYPDGLGRNDQVVLGLLLLLGNLALYSRAFLRLGGAVRGDKRKP